MCVNAILDFPDCTCLLLALERQKSYLSINVISVSGFSCLYTKSGAVTKLPTRILRRALTLRLTLSLILTLSLDRYFKLSGGELL